MSFTAYPAALHPTSDLYVQQTSTLLSMTARRLSKSFQAKRLSGITQASSPSTLNPCWSILTSRLWSGLQLVAVETILWNRCCSCLLAGMLRSMLHHIEHQLEWDLQTSFGDSHSRQVGWMTRYTSISLSAKSHGGDTPFA